MKNWIIIAVFILLELILTNGRIFGRSETEAEK